MLYTHIHKYIHTYIHTYMHTYVCTYICVCVYIYTHIGEALAPPAFASWQPPSAEPTASRACYYS